MAYMLDTDKSVCFAVDYNIFVDEIGPGRDFNVVASDVGDPTAAGDAIPFQALECRRRWCCRPLIVNPHPDSVARSFVEVIRVGLWLELEVDRQAGLIRKPIGNRDRQQ
jgi:hypothetical protein